MTKIALVVAFLVSLSAATAGQQTDMRRVSIQASGTEQRAFFIASPQPNPGGGPVVPIHLPSGLYVRASDGVRIVGFEFAGWTEGDATRVQVFTLVPRDGAPDADLRYRPDLLESRQFASYRVGAGEAIAIAEMRSLGIEPMIVRSESMRDVFARLQKLAEALRNQKP